MFNDFFSKKEYYIQYDLKLKEKLKVLLYNELYHLYSDEGGMLGTPRFIISTKRIKNSNATYHYEYNGHMNHYSIHNYILGRLITWRVGNNKDYMDEMKIEIKL